MSRKEREKGLRAEREFAKAIGGERVPLSGAAGGEFTGDVVALNLKWQVKVRKGGFKLIYEALKGHDALAIKQDRHGWLVVMPVDTLLNLDEVETR
jgi:Holliday junction resolvase